MYGQMTAGSWIYIGSQGIVQERMRPSTRLPKNTSAGPSKADSVYRGSWRNGRCATLAITMAEGVCLAAEVEEWRAQKRVETRYLDIIEHDLDKASDLALGSKPRGE